MSRFAQRIDGPVAVVGDVHGQTEQLAAVLDALEGLPDLDGRWVVFLGDLVDRGPDPAGAVRMVAEFAARHPRTTGVCGNHELAMLGALGWIPAPKFCRWPDRWLGQYQSETTFTSYGAEFGDLGALAAAVPDAHRGLLAGLPWAVEHPDYLFVHAGLDPAMPLELQLRLLRQKDFSLNRPQWLCSRTLALGAAPTGCRQTVVSGHVRVPQVEFDKRRIRVDTSGGEGGPLSCVLLPEGTTLSSADLLATRYS